MTLEPRAPSRTPETGASDVVFESGNLGAARATVCVTLYNYEKYISDALMSVYDQTLEDIALVVLDDCSQDDGYSRVESWMRSYADRFTGLRLARHAQNQGLARTRNGAVSMSGSECVMILDADNLLHPRCVERLAESLEGSRYGFVYPIVEQFGEGRSLISAFPWDVEYLKKDNYVDAMAMLRKSVWRDVGGYSRMQVAGWEDFDFWCKCVEAGHEGLLVPEILARYRLHGTSMLQTETNALSNALRMREEMRRLHPWLELKDISPVTPPSFSSNRRSPHAALIERSRSSA